MSIALKTRKMLWGRSGGICAICKERLFEDEFETDDPSVLGEECHIVAREQDGPRGTAPLPVAKRDLFANLVLLCLKCHKIIDDQPEKYSIEQLHQIKADHLKWFQEISGQYDQTKQRDDEIYASIIDEWSEKADLNGWDGFSYLVLSEDQPKIRLERERQLGELRAWLFGRIYPGRYPDLEASLENFRKVLTDFHDTFREHAEEHDWGYKTAKFYKPKGWDPEFYQEMSKKYDYHVGLVQDLFVELTRAANFVSEKVRERISPQFRLKEGITLARTGPMGDGSDRIVRLIYESSERGLNPYPGLELFRIERFNRNYHFGNPND